MAVLYDCFLVYFLTSHSFLLPLFNEYEKEIFVFIRFFFFNIMLYFINFHVNVKVLKSIQTPDGAKISFYQINRLLIGAASFRPFELPTLLHDVFAEKCLPTSAGTDYLPIDSKALCTDLSLAFVKAALLNTIPAWYGQFSEWMYAVFCALPNASSAISVIKAFSDMSPDFLPHDLNLFFRRFKEHPPLQRVLDFVVQNFTSNSTPNDRYNMSVVDSTTNRRQRYFDPECTRVWNDDVRRIRNYAESVGLASDIQMLVAMSNTILMTFSKDFGGEVNSAHQQLRLLSALKAAMKASDLEDKLRVISLLGKYKLSAMEAYLLIANPIKFPQNDISEAESNIEQIFAIFAEVRARFVRERKLTPLSTLIIDELNKFPIFHNTSYSVINQKTRKIIQRVVEIELKVMEKDAAKANTEQIELGRIFDGY